MDNFFDGKWYSVDNPPPLHDETWRDVYGDEHSESVSDDVILWDNIMEEYVIGRYSENREWVISSVYYPVERVKKIGFTHWTFPSKPPKED